MSTHPRSLSRVQEPVASAPGRPADLAGALPLDDDWDATGVLIFATSLLTLGGSGVVLLLRVMGLIA